ncbi:MAG: DNA polymerase III subunit beta [Candidatus Eisenbacteria bacterium]|uniref:Beta sliding clamp n=1 Tax=Eiseniibacteriota bacterium TaxID=2212470 RepID=A0A538T6L0_UNCEI|nr:MAG: DNA polymerase III subunit beta [Candidatus Eisenbacteria bacterium]
MITAQEVAMKFSIAQTELLDALQVVSSAVPTRTTLPVLSNILLEASEDRIEMRATDLDLAISTRARASVKDVGTLTVPAKKLFELVRKLPKEELKIEAKDLTLNVESKGGRYKFLCIRPEEFPAIPTVTPDVEASLDADLLERLIRRTIYSVSTDETRPALNGSLFQIRDGELRIVATDGHRLSKASCKPPGGIPTPPKGDVIVPLKALNQVLRLLSGAAQPVQIGISKNHARFAIGDTTLTTKLIEGPFPNYEQVLPKQNNKHLRVKRENFAQALERVSVFSDSLTRQVKLSLRPNRLTLIVQTPDQGEATEELDAQYGSDDLDIGYNAAYLLDILRTVDSEEVDIRLNTPVTAGLIAPAALGDKGSSAKEDLLCLVMPLRLAS